jgi:adenylosuccinate lyase
VAKFEKRDRYTNPLVDRYAAPRTSFIFSPHFKFRTWRKLWIALAEAEKELGVPISDEQIAEMREHIEEIDYARVSEIEAQARHDVVAHIRAFGEICPKAAPIIHLGATSAFVGDNTDMIQLREGLGAIVSELTCVIDTLADFASRHKGTPALGFTHFQPAQPTTIGKRATLWLQDVLLDMEQCEHALSTLRLRGAKGTTGTQASYLKLLGGDHEKVRELDRLGARKMGFSTSYGVTGQTYPRKVDFNALACLSGIAQSAHKFANDVRLLSRERQIEEPFGSKQVGSSAMAYKRNPMRCELITSLARLVISLSANPAMTASEQWLERTLDDSANRRISLPTAFLAAEVILRVWQNVVRGLVVNEDVVRSVLEKELPFMTTEEIIVQGVDAGGDRQELHERIRKHSMEALKGVRLGRENDLLERLRQDAAFAKVDFEALRDASQFIGRSAEQVEEFLTEEVEPVRERYKDVIKTESAKRKPMYEFE